MSTATNVDAQRTPVRVPFSGEDPGRLVVRLGACRLSIISGDENPWVEGTYTDPSGEMPLRLSVEGSTVVLSQSRTVQSAVGLLRGVPTCELRLGTAHRYHLEIESGASEVDLQLGGLPLAGLEVRQGAGTVDLRCDTPTTGEMERAELGIGAGAMQVRSLANLGAREVFVSGGGSGVVLDLDGELSRELYVRLSASLSGVELTVPKGRDATITTRMTLGGTDIGDGFVTRDGAIHTLREDDAQPPIRVDVDVALGGLTLRTR